MSRRALLARLPSQPMVHRESTPELGVPRRASFAQDPAAERALGWIVRLSVAGLEIESLEPPDLGAPVHVWAELVDGEGLLEMSGEVEWTSFDRFAVQFASLGVRETRAILRASSRPPAA